MATLAELTTLIVNIIQDDSFTSKITTYLNQGVIEIAGGMQSSLGDHITPPLPGLFTIDTVATSEDDAYVDMPATFGRNLQMVVSADGYEIEIYNSMLDFSTTYPSLTTSGNISAVIEYGNKLYYQGIPLTTEDVTIHFYRLPVAMAATTDVPDGIPSHLQVSLLVNYVCFEIFKLIEDGIEGEESNTKKYSSLLANALRTLELSIPYDTHSFNRLN